MGPSTAAAITAPISISPGGLWLKGHLLALYIRYRRSSSNRFVGQKGSQTPAFPTRALCQQDSVTFAGFPGMAEARQRTP